MQPCPYQPGCCKYEYTVIKNEKGEITNIQLSGYEYPQDDCQDYGEAVCVKICNPSGYLSSFGRGKDKESVNMINIGVYPNPNDGSIRLELNGITEGKMELVISDNTGNIVYSEVLDKRTEFFKKYLNMNNFPKGIYNFGLYQGSKKLSAGSFIIK